MKNEALQLQLAKAGITSAALAGCEGGSVLVVAAGGRVLRLTGAAGGDFLWVNPAVMAGGVSDITAEPGWSNLGGDRTWVSPEVDFFIRDRQDPAGTYSVPASCDPGNYSLEARGNAVSLTACCALRHYPTGEAVEFTINKIVTAAPNPLHYDADFGLGNGIEYVGYQQRTTIEHCAPANAGVRIGLWSLAQVPATGQILIPATETPLIRRYFGAELSGRVVLRDGAAHFPVDGRCSLKIGVKAPGLTGRLGYWRPESAEAWSLLIRSYHLVPDGQYVDVPWDDLLGADTGYVVQCYCDDGELGGFGELEHHAPAIGGNTGSTAYTDDSQMWAFRAKPETIAQIAKLLLGVAIPGSGV